MTSETFAAYHNVFSIDDPSVCVVCRLMFPDMLRDVSCVAVRKCTRKIVGNVFSPVEGSFLVDMLGVGDWKSTSSLWFSDLFERQTTSFTGRCFASVDVGDVTLQDEVIRGCVFLDFYDLKRFLSGSAVLVR